MKLLGLSLLVVGLTLSVAPAVAQEATSFQLETHSEPGSGYFTLAGQTARNPTLNVPANQQITITITAKDSDLAHNLCVGSASTCTTGDNGGYVNAEGQTATITFNSGAANQNYFCVPHQGAGMKGTIAVAGAAVEEKGSPGVQVVGVAIAMLGAALLLRYRRQA